MNTNRFLVDTIDDLLLEDDWKKGYTCKECGNATFFVLNRFDEIRHVCEECGETLDI